ncbi:hypothetical protein CBFG_02043 [Clostridiales bacterium 1_7_47FAA]|nr:hypothetical protein CBFG_02043 [Clostridiales bacterium 1_7_47FAA]
MSDSFRTSSRRGSAAHRQVFRQIPSRRYLHHLYMEVEIIES